jgi:predicted nucleic acid-binding protein
MPGDKPFFDTNILIYAFAISDPRQEIALDLLLRGGKTGVQALNEFVNVVAGKLKNTWEETTGWLQTIEALCPSPVELTMNVHRRGLSIAVTHRYHLYDCMMLAAAIESNCTIFYSEDMQDGQVIGFMTIRNPFRRR